MGTKDPRVDAYIARAPEFARPILVHLRKVVHGACPDVDETIKWGHPSFVHDGLLCGMAAFQKYCALSFWKGALILDGSGHRADEAWGHLGRVTTLADLPPARVLAGYVRQAVALNEQGVSVPRSRPRPKPGIPVPAELAAALRKHASARSTFESLSPSHRREYLEWITEAKRADTRARRIATTIEWLTAGRTRNWKYERTKTAARRP